MLAHHTEGVMHGGWCLKASVWLRRQAGIEVTCIKINLRN